MELLSGGNSRRIAIAVAAVGGAAAGYAFALWRLRELPDFGEADAALGGAWRALREGAAGCGRTGIIDGPVNDLASRGICADVFCGDDVAVVCRGDTGAVDAGAEAGGGDGVDPGVDVGLLLGQQ